MISLTQLEILVAVEETGGFSSAAKRLYLSQPSVSNQIRNLETSLGVPLVQRTPQGARCTPAGRVVVDHARQILGLLDSLQSAVADHRGLEAGQLVVAGTSTLGSYLLPRLLADFAASAPRVVCQIRVGNEAAVEGWLLSGAVALGLCADLPREDQLIAEPLLEEQMVLVAAESSGLAGRRLQPGDLADQRFLMRELGSATRRQQQAALHSWGLRAVDEWDLWGLDTVKESVLAGLGIALLSENVVARELAAGTLVRLTVDPAPAPRTVSLVRRADRTLTPPERAFVAQLQSIRTWPV